MRRLIDVSASQGRVLKVGVAEGDAPDVMDDLAGRGVVLKAAGMGTVAEEMPQAYKDVAEVVGVMDGAGISTRVAQLRPLGVIKG